MLMHVRVDGGQEAGRHIQKGALAHAGSHTGTRTLGHAQMPVCMHPSLDKSVSVHDCVWEMR